jgi:CBS domain-containing protein
MAIRSRRTRPARRKPAIEPVPATHPPAREALGFYGYRVRDVMTKPVVTIGPSAPLADAATRMSRRAISGLAVVEGAGQLVGVLSQKDILRVLGEKAGLRLPGSVLDLVLGGSRAGRSDLADACRRVLASTTVAEVMSRPARTIGPGASLDDAVKALVAGRINRLPVVHEGRLVGIVTRTDLLSGLSTSTTAA